MKDNLLIHLKVEKANKNMSSDIETMDLLELIKLLKYTAAVEMIDPLLLTSLCRLSRAMLMALQFLIKTTSEKKSSNSRFKQG
jgi:hypothetical protein